MKFMMVMPSLLLATATLVIAEEICGNPCPKGFVWTDKDMGKCVPEPPKTS